MAKVWLGLLVKGVDPEQRVQRWVPIQVDQSNWLSGRRGWFLPCFYLCSCSSAVPGHTPPLWLSWSMVLWWAQRPDVKGKESDGPDTERQQWCMLQNFSEPVQFSIGRGYHQHNRKANYCWKQLLATKTDNSDRFIQTPVLACDPNYHLTSAISLKWVCVSYRLHGSSKVWMEKTFILSLLLE